MRDILQEQQTRPTKLLESMRRDLPIPAGSESPYFFRHKPHHLTHPTYRADIDGLRAIAVLAVVSFHAFPYWVKGGFVGVDIFFVISGFLISTIIFSSLEHGDFSFREFYARRVKRIFPALLLVLVACYLFGWFALLAKEYEQLGKHIAAGASFISNFTLWNEAGYFDNSGETKPLLHLWSLGIEEQFYIVWPLLLWFAWKKRIDPFKACLLVILVSFGVNAATINGQAVAAFYSPFSRFWELSCGSLLAYFLLYRHERFPETNQNFATLFKKFGFSHISNYRVSTWLNVIAWSGVFLVILAVLLLSRDKLFPGWWALLPTVGACLILAAGPTAWFNRRILSNNFLVKIGLISYPLYLWHWPLLAFARIVEGQTPAKEVRIGAVLISIALAWLTYRFIEKPVRFGAYQKAKIIMLCVLMSIIGYIGYNTYERGGLAFRLRNFEAKIKDIKRVQESTPSCKQAIPIKELRYCNLAEPNRDPTVVLIGDSHGNRLYESLAANYSKVGENLLQIGGGGCLPFWDVETGSPGQPNKCNEQMNPQLDFVLNKPSIKTVIFANRGPLNIEGDDPSSGRKYFIKDMKSPEVEDAKQIYKDALIKSANKLKANGKNVVLLIDAPEFPYDPLQCLNLDRPFSSPFKKRPDCTISKSSVEQRNRNYIKVTKDAADKLGLEVINLQDALCDTKSCFALKDGALLYMDADHLNYYGAKLVIDNLWSHFPK